MSHAEDQDGKITFFVRQNLITPLKDTFFIGAMQGNEKQLESAYHFLYAVQIIKILV